MAGLNGIWTQNRETKNFSPSLPSFASSSSFAMNFHEKKGGGGGGGVNSKILNNTNAARGSHFIRILIVQNSGGWTFFSLPTSSWGRQVRGHQIAWQNS